MVVFSIILPTYNRLPSLKKTLNSLFRSLIGFSNWELIIIDNNSPDGTFDFCNKEYGKNPNIILIKNDKPSAYASRNMGIKLSHGRYIILAEDDLIIPEDWFAKLNNLVKKYPGQRVFSYKIDSQEIYSHVLTAIQEFEKKQLLQNNSKTGCISAPSLFARRDIFDDYGLFLENNRGGDIEFTLRLLKNNEPVLTIEDIFVYHEFVLTFRNFIRRSFAYGFSFSSNVAAWSGVNEGKQTFIQKIIKNFKMPVVWAKASDKNFIFSAALGFAHETAFIVGGLASRFILKQNPVT